MDNVIANIGDSIIVKTAPKITGKIHFTNYTETIIGETENRTLERIYRISTDGIFWSEWKQLSVDNISNEIYVTENSIFIEIKYTRSGTDATGEIVFKSITFQGSHENIEFVAPTLISSIFGKLLGTTDLQRLEQNIFKKLYYRGVIPAYVTRGNNDSYKEDRDYIDFFYSVARFFSLILRFFKRWENMRNDEEMLREQIRGYNIFFDESSITLEELKYIAANILSIIQQRGTEMIFVRKGEELPNGEVAKIDGEAIRLIRSRVSDELLYDAIPKWKMGWCMGNSSPMYKGTCQSFNLNKTPDNISNFSDLDKYNTVGNCSIAVGDGKQFIKILGDGGIAVGTGDISNYLIVMDSQLDYEITFAVRVNTNVGKLRFSIAGYDILKRQLNDAFIRQDGSLVDNVFFEEELSRFIPGEWYYVRGIVHAYSTAISVNDKTNLNCGQDLVFNNYFTKYVYPEIQVVESLNSDVDIWDYKIRPLIHGKNLLPLKDGSTDSRSLGFIQAHSVFYTYMRNNNNSQSVSEITDIMDKYLYPFNTVNLFTILSNI